LQRINAASPSPPSKKPRSPRQTAAGSFFEQSIREADLAINCREPAPFKRLRRHPTRRDSGPPCCLPAPPSQAPAALLRSSGFDKVKVSDGAWLNADHYQHYLHHKYFEVNYADGLVPFDRLFGAFHDGAEEANAALKQRRIAKRG